MDQSLLGVGLYSVHEAARITRIPAAHIRRWLWGYRYRVAGQLHEKSALWKPQLSPIGDAKGLTFRDLIEVQFVERFRKEGVSLHAIRKTIDLATHLIDETYPLSSVRFKTDGKGILAHVLKSADEPGIVFDLATGQHLFEFVLADLYDAIEYSNLDELLRWWPLGKDRRVVVDPKKSFGRPIVLEGVSTAILSRAADEKISAGAVARWFEISEQSVVDAVDFENSLKAA